VSPRRLTVPNLRAVLWTLRALRIARKELRCGDWESIELPRLPRLPAGAERAVEAVLRRSGATCLSRAIVRQAWFAAHGSPRDLVVGVTAPSRGFEAHAWLEGDPPCHTERYQELLRRPARV
jgi:Transglutaminase-like superfamily